LDPFRHPATQGGFAAASINATEGPNYFTGGIDNGGGGVNNTGPLSGVTSIDLSGAHVLRCHGSRPIARLPLS
jgi:hypothetical protein